MIILKWTSFNSYIQSINVWQAGDETQKSCFTNWTFRLIQPDAAEDSHLCAVHVPINGKDMSRNGVNKVEQPDEAQTQQQGLGSAPLPVKVPDTWGHTPQCLEVERTEEERRPHVDRSQPHPDTHEGLTPLFGGVQLEKEMCAYVHKFGTFPD